MKSAATPLEAESVRVCIRVVNLEARKDKNWDCYVFHDVDLLLQNQTIPYHCSSNKTRPVHLSVAISKYQYFFTNTQMIGGVSLFTEQGLKLVNARVFVPGISVFRLENVIGSNHKKNRKKCKNEKNLGKMAVRRYYASIRS